MKVFTKQPREILDYDVDMTEWFSTIPGDEIDSVDIIVTSMAEEPTELIVGPAPHTDVVLIGTTPVVFKVWLGGGSEYVDYTVNCIINTLQHRKKEVEFKIKVRDK